MGEKYALFYKVGDGYCETSENRKSTDLKVLSNRQILKKST